jgi:branched-subunit amino acid aminotransferase/4-amino-4-deoxychorismate lyase
MPQVVNGNEAPSTPLLFAVVEDGAQQLELPRPARDVHELFDDLPVGIYEALRLMEGARVFRLPDYLTRAEQSLRLHRIDTKLDRRAIRRALAQAAAAWGNREARIRLDVFARPAPALHLSSVVFLSLSEYPPLPVGVMETGVQVGVAEGKHRRMPRAKSAAWVLERRGIGPGDSGMFEHLLVSAQGDILECTSANFFAIKGTDLYTAGEDILEGITRKLVLEIARTGKIPVHLEPVNLRDLAELSGAFLTSSTRGPVPITRVQDTVIGDGRPPAIFEKVRQIFDEWVEDEAEQLRAG